jgi:hypothetical protein
MKSAVSRIDNAQNLDATYFLSLYSADKREIPGLKDVGGHCFEGKLVVCDELEQFTGLMLVRLWMMVPFFQPKEHSTIDCV